MTSFLLAEPNKNLFNTLIDFIQDAASKITLEYILYGAIALLVLTLLITFIRTNCTYEAKLLRKTKKLNKYLVKHQNIDDNNLVEFNNKMKQVPKVVRHRWQEYMLNRDKPSSYINCDSCIDIPTRVSGYKSTLKISRIFISIICSLTFILGLGNFYNATGKSTYSVLFITMLVPIFLFVLGVLFIAFLSARHTAIMADLYYNFQQFEMNLDLACKTLPEVIDYEILFTKKEIKENIPSLQEYLEKAEKAEKKRKEDEAMISLIGENYDFEELGVDSSLLLERAMKESEKYLNVKRNFSERIRNKEQEKVNYQKNFDEVTKDFERKAQASREIINTVSDQINETTVKIEANYLKKKLNEEQARYQQYEKDYDVASTRFQKEQQDIQYEIDKFNNEIKRRKEQATENMLSEGKTYVNKIYGQVTETVLKQNQPILDETELKIKGLNDEITRLNAIIEEKEELITKRDKTISETKQELNVRLAELEAVKNLREYMTSVEFRERLTMSKRELKKMKNVDREAFNYVKGEMKLPASQRIPDAFEEDTANVQVVKLDDNVADDKPEEKSKKSKPIQLPEDEIPNDVKVVKLEDDDSSNNEPEKPSKADDLDELTKDIEDENTKLAKNKEELDKHINEVKPKARKSSAPDTSELREKMAKLNIRTKKAPSKDDDEDDDKKDKKPNGGVKVPTFNFPKIKK